MYSIKELAMLSGVSTRTLRYYDEINLLKPCSLSESGCRQYSTIEVDRLQLILYYKELDFNLEDIKRIMDNDNYDVTSALVQQQRLLLQKKERIEKILTHIEETILYYKGEIEMTDQAKFEAFKQEKLTWNEQQYGEEIRGKYGEEVVNQANKNWQHLSQEDYQRATIAENRLISELNYLLNHHIDDLNHPSAEAAFEAHREWLEIMAPFYSKEYHRTLGEMYVSDQRFSQYYNSKTEQDSVELLKKIIDKWKD